MAGLLKPRSKVLVVDDEKIIRTTFALSLEDADFTVVCVASGKDALEAVRVEQPDVVILDLKMPKMDGMETLRELKKIFPDLPVIMVTAYGDIGMAVNAIKLGAHDFILKPPDFDMLIYMLQRVIDTRKLQREVEMLGTEVKSSLEYLLGKSAAIKKAIEQVQLVSRSNFSVLIQGETGTGKSLIAGVIHNLSDRKNGPLISVDMGALPETLVESELFGYEKGAFTGAIGKKRGFFELADKGTLVIDELQNMSAYVQGKLLKVVEEKKIYALGSREPLRVDARVIGITNVGLMKLVENKTFREDLFYRLSEVTISIPSLRDRKEDIPFFAEKFLLETCEELCRPAMSISDSAQTLLSEYRWPGNVRELKNVMRRATLFASGKTISREDIECLIQNEETCNPVIYSSTFRELPLMSLRNMEKIMIKQALEFTDGNKTKAASLLNIDYKTLLRKIRISDC